jgi:hypothetical protein
LNRELEQRVAERTAELQSYAGRLLQSEHRRNLALAAGQMGSWDWISLMATACGTRVNAASLGSILRLSRRRPKVSKACSRPRIGNGYSKHGSRHERMGILIRLNFVCAVRTGSYAGA